MEKITDIEKIASEMNQLTNLLKEAEKNEATLSGRLQEAMKRLAEEDGLKSVEEAKTALADLSTQEKTLQTQIIRKFQTLQESYEW